MKPNQNFLCGWVGGGGFETKRISMGGVWIFCGTTECHACKQSANEKYTTVCDITSFGKFFARRMK